MQRAAAGVPALSENAVLRDMAQAYAQYMAAHGFFSHTDPQGRTFQDRIAASGYSGTANAENLGLTTGSDMSVVIAGWMNSPPHRTNMLNPVYVVAGTGMATGTWQGSLATYVVAVFGNVK